MIKRLYWTIKNRMAERKRRKAAKVVKDMAYTMVMERLMEATDPEAWAEYQKLKNK